VLVGCWRVNEIDQAQPIPASRIAQERRWVLRVLERFIFVSFRITPRSMWLIMGHQNGSGNSMLVRRLSRVSTWCQRAVDRWKLKVWRKPRYFVRANPVSQHVWLLSNWIVCWRRAQYTKEELNIQKKSSIYKRRAQYTKEELNIQKKYQKTSGTHDVDRNGALCEVMWRYGNEPWCSVEMKPEDILTYIRVEDGWR
jgi:hypothetical protein